MPLLFYMTKLCALMTVFMYTQLIWENAWFIHVFSKPLSAYYAKNIWHLAKITLCSVVAFGYDLYPGIFTEMSVYKTIILQGIQLGFQVILIGIAFALLEQSVSRINMFKRLLKSMSAPKKENEHIDDSFKIRSAGH